MFLGALVGVSSMQTRAVLAALIRDTPKSTTLSIVGNVQKNNT